MPLIKLDLAGNALTSVSLPADATNLVNVLHFANQLTNVTLPSLNEALKNHGLASKLRPNKTPPHFIRLPDRVQIPFRLGDGEALVQHAMKKHERGDTLIGRAVNKHTLSVKRRHHPTKNCEILGRWRIKSDRDVNVYHSKACYDTAFVRQGVIGSRQREIDDHVITSVSNIAKLFRRGLTRGGELVANDAVVANRR